MYNARMVEIYTEAAQRERLCGDINGLADDFERFSVNARVLTARLALQCAAFLENVA